MCDLGSIAGIGKGTTVYSSPIGPTLTGKAMGSVLPKTSSLQTFGELAKTAGGAIGSFGEEQQYGDLAAQREARIGQILAATKQSLELKAIEQGRSRSTQANQISRSGVAMTGTAKDFLAQQDRLDEIALETAKQQGIVQIRGEEAERKAAVTSKKGSIGKGLAQAGELITGGVKGFGLG